MNEVRRDRPSRAPPVDREKIARLYATDARGIQDERVIGESHTTGPRTVYSGMPPATGS